MSEHSLHLTITEDQRGDRLDKFLATALPDLSRGQIQAAIKEGAVLVNGKPSKPAARLSEGDTIAVTLPEIEATEIEILPEPMPLDVLYEDDQLAVINKPPDLVVHPGNGNWSGTLVNGLLARWDHLMHFPDRERAGIVHRLDKDTSGVILVALTETAQAALMAQFQERTIEKTYWALVEGRPESESGQIDAPVGRDPKKRKQMTVIHDGRPAFSTFQVMETFPNHTLLAVQPKTGRTHQIRVHLAFIGHPVVADTVYGYRKPSLKMKRLFLHARTIAFDHPATGERLQVEADLPGDLQHVLGLLRQP